MKELKFTGQFRKDIKRIRNNPKKIEALKKVLFLLRESGMLTKEYKPHMLTGYYKGYMECHVESDLLLLWLDEVESVIKLVRLGSHSELFG